MSKEEPKQENCCTPLGQIKKYVDCYGCDRKPKQERSYSDEDLRQAFKQSRQAFIFEKDMPCVYDNFDEWFEQFKNK